MQQHPIPQNVMSVEFQLIGGLTVRQFAYISIGGLIDLLLFILPVSGYIKWPFMIIISGFILALAYIPINDIGFDRWIIAFYRAINSPTKRVWRKEIKRLSVLADDYSKKIALRAENPPAVADRTKLNEYLATLRVKEPRSNLDIAEDAYIKSLPFGEALPSPILNTSLPPAMTIPVEEERRVVEEDLTQPSPLVPRVKPIITVHMPDKNIYVKKVSTTTVNRQLHTLSSLEGTVVLPIRGETTFEPSEELKHEAAPSLPVLTEAYQPPIPVAPPLTPPVPPSPPPVITPPPPKIEPAPVFEPIITQPPPPPLETPRKPFIDIHKIEQKLAAETEAARQELLKKARSIATPPNETPVLPPNAAPVTPTANIPVTPIPTPQEAPLPQNEASSAEGLPPSLSEKYPEAPPEPTKSSNRGVPATLAIGRMAPSASSVPNVIVGLVKDKNGLLLTDVVVIVKDLEGDPVRALKSNKVGQFAVTTPLPNGRYMIDLEKEGYAFDTIAVLLDGNIFQPIEVRAK